MNAYRIYHLNEHALTIEFGSEINPAVNNQAMALHHALQKESFSGFIESVPAYTTLTVYYDLWQVNKTRGSGFQTASQYVQSLIREKLNIISFSASAELPVLEVPVCYDLSMAPDLPWVAEYCRLTIPEVISLHTNEIYRVYMIGFIPGFPYMGMLPAALEVPRKLRPALSVPAGSVALAGRQTGIYPFSIPGGWQVIGRTALRLFDVNRHPCCALEVGQPIKFVPVSLEEFKHQSGL
jgi:inhibitor of KinA